MLASQDVCKFITPYNHMQDFWGWVCLGNVFMFETKRRRRSVQEH